MSNTDPPRIERIDSNDSRARFRSDARGLKSEKIGASAPTSQGGDGTSLEPGRACVLNVTSARPGSFYHQQISWTPHKISLLRELWSEGLIASDIAGRMGVSKNSIIGAVHRFKFPKRNSPIHPRKKPKIEPPKLLTLADLGAGQCLWPLGDPGDVDFHFCGDRIQIGRSYCVSHCVRAYVRVVKPASL